VPRDLSSAECWIIGTGRMAGCYAEVLQDQDVPFSAVGRSMRSAEAFAARRGALCFAGGVGSAVEAAGCAPRSAIVAVDVEELAPVCHELMAAGTRRILVEKPGASSVEDLEQLAVAAVAAETQIHVGYNRRHYASVRRLRELAAEDGGIVSFTFEFTELSDAIAGSAHPPVVKRNWLLANSTHVIDTAFFIGGEPRRFFSHIAGGLEWHPRAARFIGAGETATGALFSYLADWDAPGRWSIQANTRRRRFILAPMEKLLVQARGSFALEEVDLGGSVDQRFKPGLHRQTRAFLSGEDDDLLGVAEAARRARAIYAPMLEAWTVTGDVQ
jgi:predicted dehydrogenase